MAEKKELLYYVLTPIHRQVGGIATAAPVFCMATGVLLSGYGGPKTALSKGIVHELDMSKSGGRSRTIVDTEVFDVMVAALKTAREDAVSGLKVLGIGGDLLEQSATKIAVDHALNLAGIDD